MPDGACGGLAVDGARQKPPTQTVARRLHGATRHTGNPPTGARARRRNGCVDGMKQCTPSCESRLPCLRSVGAPVLQPSDRARGALWAQSGQRGGSDGDLAQAWASADTALRRAWVCAATCAPQMQVRRAGRACHTVVRVGGPCQCSGRENRDGVLGAVRGGARYACPTTCGTMARLTATLRNSGDERACTAATTGDR